MTDLDTICSVSTPVGEGGIGIIRISGRSAITVAAKIFRAANNQSLTICPTHRIQYGHIADPHSGEIVDEVLVSVMRAPASYTREDVVEINCHGGMVPLWIIVRLLINAGARHAEPGEFTRRAFLNGRIDLAQAEAVMDVIHARTEMSLRAANEQLLGGLSREIGAVREQLVGVVAGVEAGVDFPEEDIETPSGNPLERELLDIAEQIQRLLDSAFYGRIVREGIATAIAGRPNVGKSSLLNALLKQERAIVTDVPGTTRDVLEECLNIGGMPLRVLDTAGIRHTVDIIEQEGVKRSLAAIGSADIVLIVLDGSRPLTEEDRRVLDASNERVAIAVINKSDLPRRLETLAWPEEQVEISCRTGAGIDKLRRTVLGLMQRGAIQPQEHAWAVNQRHQTALEQTKRSLEQALGSVRSVLSPEFIALDLREALDQLGTIIGATYTDDILERIFRDFCIGK
jgi:tRNA modification GTPase